MMISNGNFDDSIYQNYQNNIFKNDILKCIISSNILDFLNINNFFATCKHARARKSYGKSISLVLTEIDKSFELYYLNTISLGILTKSLTDLTIGSPHRHHTINALITDIDMKSVAKLQSLKKLKLDNLYKITDTGLSYLSQLPLQQLSLIRCNKINGSGFNIFKKMPLTFLELNDIGEVTSTNFSHLSELSLLNTLILAHTYTFTDKNLSSISQLPLHTLLLERCYITNAGLEYLANLPLQKLSLQNMEKITNDGLIHLIELPIKDLTLVGMDNINDDGLKHIKKLPLSHLTLAGMDNINDEA